MGSVRAFCLWALTPSPAVSTQTRVVSTGREQGPGAPCLALEWRRGAFGVQTALRGGVGFWSWEGYEAQEPSGVLSGEGSDG